MEGQIKMARYSKYEHKKWPVRPRCYIWLHKMVFVDPKSGPCACRENTKIQPHDFTFHIWNTSTHILDIIYISPLYYLAKLLSYLLPFFKSLLFGDGSFLRAKPMAVLPLICGLLTLLCPIIFKYKWVVFSACHNTLYYNFQVTSFLIYWCEYIVHFAADI